MRKCVVCGKRNGPGNGSFFQIPSIDWRRQQWSKVCQKELKGTERICSDHFLPKDFIVGARIKLIPSAVPSVGIVSETGKELNSLIENKVLVPNGPEVTCENFGAQEDSNDDPNDWTCEFLEEEPQEYFSEMIVDEQYESFAQLEEKGVDCCTQTDCNVIASISEMENCRLRMEVKKLQNENAKLKDELESANIALSKMKTIFTENQIRKMGNPEKRVHWRWEDISAGICLHACGPRAYNHLYTKGFPLPSISSLQRWARKIEVNPGVLNVSLDFMRGSNDFSKEDKVCVISFDEMKVAEAYEYNAAQDCVLKPSNYVQVVMVRGLRKSWKQPIFFDFDCKLSKEIIMKLIVLLHKAGYPVVGMVSDMGPTNRKLWRTLEVTTEKPWFQSPVDIEGKVFVFADAPHLIKLIRNHFLDTGLMWKDSCARSRQAFIFQDSDAYSHKKLE